jgi:hypothetical protein
MMACSQSGLLEGRGLRGEISVGRELRDYEAYGLSVRSQIPLTFPERLRSEAVDVTLTMAAPEWFARATADAPANPNTDGWYQQFSCPDGSDLLRWPDLFEFLVAPDGRSVACRMHEQATLESFQTYLFGHVMSYVLVKQGYEPLHATAVAIDGIAVALLGECGSGKSTLAASLVAAGHRILTDDLLLLRDVNGVLCGFPGPSRLKLFPEVAKVFLPDLAWSAPMNPLTDKLIVPLAHGQRESRPIPACRFFALDSSDLETQVAVTPVTPADSLIEILRATFNSRLVSPRRLRQQFLAAHRLATRIPVRRLAYPRRMDVLDQVHRAILADLQRASELLS